MATAPVRAIRSVPSWDELFGDPSLFEGLTPEAQDAVYEQVATVEVKFRLMRKNGRPQQIRVEADRLVLIEEAAKMLATSEDTLYSKWKKLPFAFKDPLDGKIKFRVSGIERHLARVTTA